MERPVCTVAVWYLIFYRTLLCPSISSKIREMQQRQLQEGIGLCLRIFRAGSRIGGAGTCYVTIESWGSWGRGVVEGDVC